MDMRIGMPGAGYVGAFHLWDGYINPASLISLLFLREIDAVCRDEIATPIPNCWLDEIHSKVLHL